MHEKKVVPESRKRAPEDKIVKLLEIVRHFQILNFTVWANIQQGH